MNHDPWLPSHCAFTYEGLRAEFNTYNTILIPIMQGFDVLYVLYPEKFACGALYNTLLYRPFIPYCKGRSATLYHTSPILINTLHWDSKSHVNPWRYSSARGPRRSTYGIQQVWWFPIFAGVPWGSKTASIARRTSCSPRNRSDVKNSKTWTS
jgi:hypothetical protein